MSGRGTKRVVVVGIPGVGKTTVLEKVHERLRAKGVKCHHAVFGTHMLGEASKMGVKGRDEIRSMPMSLQRDLQIMACREIASIDADLLLVDTHLFVNTKEGLWPGLPEHVLRILSPSNLILIQASPSEILQRRSRDTARERDWESKSGIVRELELARSMLMAAGMLTGAAMLIVDNNEGKAEQAADSIVRVVEGSV